MPEWPTGKGTPKPGTIKFDDKKWRQIMKQIAKSDEVNVRVGVLASKGGNTAHDGGDMTLVEIAAVHEFGSSDGVIPQRSFIRRAMVEHQAEITKKQAELAARVVTLEISVETALDLLGVFATALIRKTIAGGASIPPPLKPATVAAKGSSRALVDTGQLINSLSHEVEKA